MGGQTNSEPSLQSGTSRCLRISLSPSKIQEKGLKPKHPPGLAFQSLCQRESPDKGMVKGPPAGRISHPEPQQWTTVAEWKLAWQSDSTDGTGKRLCATLSSETLGNPRVPWDFLLLLSLRTGVRCVAGNSCQCLFSVVLL